MSGASGAFLAVHLKEAVLYDVLLRAIVHSCDGRLLK